MQIRLIRNATLRIRYGGLNFLTDPVLSEKGGIDSFAGIAPNPTVPLPCPVQEVVDGVDAVLASHLHQDHFDKPAGDLIDHDTPAYCQPVDENSLRNKGFHTVFPVDDKVDIGEVTLFRTAARHGSGKWEQRLGSVSGFVFRCPDEPILYWAGDTIWCREVEEVLERFKPDLILTHSCGAELKDSGPIIMDHIQTVALCRAAPAARVIAIHMEALDHATVTRRKLRRYADEQGIAENRLLIPKDGEWLEF